MFSVQQVKQLQELFDKSDESTSKKISASEARMSNKISTEIKASEARIGKKISEEINSLEEKLENVIMQESEDLGNLIQDVFVGLENHRKRIEVLEEEVGITTPSKF